MHTHKRGRGVFWIGYYLQQIFAKLVVEKQHKFTLTILEVRSSKIKVLVGLYLLWRLQRTAYFLAFPDLIGFPNSFVSSSFIFKGNSVVILTLTFLLCSFTLRILLIIGMTQIIQNNLPTSRLVDQQPQCPLFILCNIFTGSGNWNSGIIGVLLVYLPQEADLILWLGILTKVLLKKWKNAEAVIDKRAAVTVKDVQSLFWV